MRDKHLIPMFQWIIRCLYLLLRHLAQTKPGAVDPQMLEDGLYFYEHVRSNVYADQDLEIS